MTGSARGVGGAGSDRVARKVADLAGRLTERDRQLCRLLAEHRVLTSHQLTQLAFNHLDTAEDRLRTLTGLGVLDRFRPRRDTGSAPYHYVLGPLGAAMLAAEQGVTVADLGYRRATALAVAHYRRLPEIVPSTGSSPPWPAMPATTRTAELACWLSQRRCHDIWGRLIQPHGFGRWRDHGTMVEFFLEYDHGEERFSDLIAALAGYDALDQAIPQLAIIVLLWITTTQREAEVHRTRPPAPLPPRHRHPTRGRQPRRGHLAPPRQHWAPATPERPRPPPLPGTGPTMNPAPATPQAACWEYRWTTRLPVEEARQRRLTVLLPEDPPLVTGPAAAVLLRMLIEAAKSHGRPGDYGH